MARTLPLTLILSLISLVPAAAQGLATVPPGFELAPGNGGLSLPARWSQGLMQVLMRQSTLPTAMQHQSLTGIQFRRPSFADEPAYAGKTLSFTLRLASTKMTMNQIRANMQDNRDLVASQSTKVWNPPLAHPLTDLTQVARETNLNLPATGPNLPGQGVGQPMINLPFSQPFMFHGPDLFVEWESDAASFTVDSGNWVDAIYLQNQGDVGLAVNVGYGGCGSVSGAGAPPMLLTSQTAHPQLGSNAVIRLENALANTDVFFNVAADSLLDQTLGGSLLDFLGAPGCYFWVEPLVVLTHSFPSGPSSVRLATGAAGSLNVSLPVPADPTLSGLRVGFQAWMQDPTTNVAQLATSNAVVYFLGSVGLNSDAATVMAYPPDPSQPWPPAPPLISPFGVMRNTVPLMQFSW